MISQLKKTLAILVTMCMFVQLFSSAFISREALAAASCTYYVGGSGADDGNDGLSSTTPFLTLAKAAQAINANSEGSYNIVIQGDTNEISGIIFGDGTKNYQITMITGISENGIPGSATGSAILSSVSGSAIVMRNSDYSGDLITVENNVTLTLGSTADTGNVPLIFDGGSVSRAESSICRVKEKGVLNIYQDTTLRNNNISNNNNGGGIYNEGILNMYGGEITNNTAWDGGGVDNKGTFTMYGGEIKNNSAQYDAGISNDGSFYNKGGSISNNHTVGIAGGIGNYGYMEMESGSVINNSAPNSYGGGIYNANNQTLKISGGMINGNQAGEQAGGIYNGGDIYFSGGSIANNTSGFKGGGIYNFGCVTMTGGTIGQNSAYTGNAVYNDNTFNLSGDTAVISDVVFCGKPITIQSEVKQSDIKLDVSPYKDGVAVLNGSAELIAACCSDFTMINDAFSINKEGKLYYSGSPATYYVGGIGASDSNTGIDPAHPLTTISKAIELNNYGKCTVIVQENLTLSNTINVYGTVSIQSKGQHTISCTGSNTVFDVNNGSLSLGGGDAGDMLTIRGSGAKTSFYYFEVNTGSCLSLCDGVSIADFVCSGSVIENYGSLIITGGKLSGNTAGTSYQNYYGGIIDNKGNCSMSGGSIQDNASLAVYNQGTFDMTGGSILDNQGGGVLNKNDFSIAGNAVIDSSDTTSGSPNKYDIYLYGSASFVRIGGAVSDSFQMAMDSYPEGRQILTGEQGILQESYQKFKLMDSNYSVTKNGKIIFVGVPKTIYVNENADAVTADGSEGKPFTDIKIATDHIGTGMGTIVLQSDILLSQPVIIKGNITIISDGSICTLTRKDGFKGYDDSSVGTYAMLYNMGNLKLGRTDKSGKDDVPDIIIDGGSKKGTVVNNSAIVNKNVLELYPGVAIENNDTEDLDLPEISVETIKNDGNLHMYGGIISGNKGGIGIINNMQNAVFLMDGGSICDNTGLQSIIKLNSKSSFIMNGGKIYGNNFERNGYVVYLSPSIDQNSGNTFRMNGGTIEYDGNAQSGSINIWDYDYFSISGNASLKGENTVAFNCHDKAFHGIEIDGALNADIPHVNITIYGLDSIGNQVKKSAQSLLGTKVLHSGNGYTFTDKDAEKFTVGDDGYAINTEGRIAKRIDDSWIAISGDTGIICDGNAKTVQVTINNGTSELVKNTDYTLSYSNNINSGTATVTINGIGSYAGTFTRNFTINPAPTKAPTPTPGTESAKAPTPTPGTEPTPTPGVVPSPAISITPIPSTTQDNTSHLDIEVPFTDMDIMKSDGKITIPVIPADILNEITNSKDANVNITVTLPDTVLDNSSSDTELVLNSKVLEAAKTTGKTLNISVKDSTGTERFTWSFDGVKPSSSGGRLSDVNLSLNIISIRNDPHISKLTGKNSQGLVLSFGEKGLLPFQTSVRVYVGDREGIEAGSRIYLYHYNSDKNTLETLPYSSDYLVDEHGYITVNIVHCSEYVMLLQKADSSIITSLRNQITIEPSHKILYTKGSGKFASVKIILPYTLKLLASLSDKISQTAVGGVTASYRSGNNKVARVDKNGRITAKGTGKTIIYTKITLYSGKTKTYKTKITVSN